MKENKDFTMHEISLSREAQTAIFKMINQTKGISPKDISEVTGDSHNTICNYGNVGMPNHLPSLKKLETIMMYTQNPEILKVWAHQLGYALVPVNCDSSKHHELSIFEAMMLSNITNGKANKAVYDAYEDGVVTPAEYEEIHALTQGLTELIAAVDQAALKQMKKYTSSLEKEKA